VIDHCLTQEIFDINIGALIQSGQGEILVLHCNIGNPRVSHENWLTEEKLDQLASQYRYVLIGHEHKFKQLRENAWYLGTPYPTNFGEMYDHYVGYLDETGKIEFVRTFAADEQYLELDIQELVDLQTTLGTFEPLFSGEIRFMKLVGSVSVEDGAKAFQWLKKLRSHSHVIAVKGEFTVRPYKNVLGSESKSEFKDFSRLLAEHVSESEIQFLDSLLQPEKL
jgi:DNA repair exonuclease SbcCD nuclease subunit